VRTGQHNSRGTAAHVLYCIAQDQWAVHQLESTAFTSPASVLCFLPEPDRTSGVPLSLRLCCIFPTLSTVSSPRLVFFLPFAFTHACLLHRRTASAAPDLTPELWLAGLMFLGSQSGNSQLLELSFRAVSPGMDQLAMHPCTVRNEALVDSLAPIQDVLVFEDPPGVCLSGNSSITSTLTEIQRPTGMGQHAAR